VRKRQFGTKRLIYASDHNTAQTYGELNTREVAVDGGIKGIIYGGVLIPNTEIEYTIILEETVARTVAGERIVVPSSSNPVVNIFIKPSIDPGFGNEVWMTAYIEYTYQLGELDTDGDGIPYYKDYQNGFQIGTVQGIIAPIGTAVKPNIPYGAVLLCDILYNSNLYLTGAIQQSDINTARQDRFDSQSFVNLLVTGTADIYGVIIARSGIDMIGTNFFNVSDPVIGSDVGDRDYNDVRYVLKSGDTMTGTLNVPDLNVSASMTIQNLTANGNLLVGGSSVFSDNVNIAGNLAVNSGGVSVGQDLRVIGSIEGKSVIIPWQTAVDYTIGEVIVFEEGIYKCKVDHTSTDFLLQIANWESIGGGGGTTHRVTIINHGFIVGDVLRYDSHADPNGYTKAKADNPHTLGQFVVIRILDADNFVISSGGYFEDTSATINFIPNTWYYLSDSTAGLLTVTEPPISNPILYAVAAHEAYVFIFRPAVGAMIATDEYIADAGQTKFPLSVLPIHQDYITVSVDGVVQSKSTYTFFSSTGIIAGIEFVTALSGGEEIRFQTISNVFSESGANLVTDTITATYDGQFTVTMSRVPISKEYILVSIDGVFQHKSAFDFTDTVLTFTDPLLAGNEVQIIHVVGMNIALDPAVVNSFVVNSSTGQVSMKNLSVSNDAGAGLENITTFTNAKDNILSTGTGSIKLKGTGTTQDSAGWLKVYIGTTACYLPYFTNITGV